jgi:hypothetical protein
MVREGRLTTSSRGVRETESFVAEVKMPQKRKRERG